MTNADVMPRRAGRVAFGLVLIAGALYLGTHAAAIEHSFDWPNQAAQGLHAWHVVVGTWLVALTASVLVTSVATLLPRHRDSDALRVSALTVPSIGIALMLPLTLHMIVVLPGGERGFDEWTLLSLLFVGHVHVLFALLVWARARSLANEVAKPLRVRTIYIVTCLVALFPIGIPAAFVAVTGLPIIPLLRYMEKVAAADREDSRDIPYAIRIA